MNKILFIICIVFLFCTCGCKYDEEQFWADMALRGHSSKYMMSGAAARPLYESNKVDFYIITELLQN